MHCSGRYFSRFHGCSVLLMSRRQTRLQDFYPQRRQNIGSQSAPSASTQKQPWAVLDDGSLNDATLGRQETNTRQRRHMDVQSFKRPTSASGTEEQHKDCSRRGTESRYRRYGEQYVVLPWSKHNTLCGRNGQTCLVFDLQVHMLTENTVATTTQLVQLMQSLMVPLIGESVAFGSSFHALAMTMDQLLSPAERESFFREVLPWMMRLLPEAIHYFGEEPLPVLAQGKNNRVLLNKPQTVILMTCAFFSLFPGRSMMQDNTRSALGISRRLPVCNFHSLFDVPSNKRCSAVHHKIRCLLEYFFIMFRQHSTGGWETDGSLVEINRVGYPTFPEFSSSEATLTPLTLVGDGLIEDDLGALHADFANKVIGGGVLRRGCVQEEIRFVVTPEALLSLLFCETMLDHEAVFISGVGQYSQYTGYGSTFQWSGGLEGSKCRLQCVELPASTCSSTMPTKLPPTMLNVSIVAMDAISFASGDRRPPAQYLASWITREANKAYVAFHGPSVEHACLQLCHTGPVATGNWGCGVFSGDVELKLLIQWCAAAVAQRPVRYYVFDRVELLKTFPPLLEKLQREHWSVGRLYSQLLFYNVYRTEECRGKTPMGLFQYLMASSEPSA